MSLATRAPLPYRLSHIGARLSLELSPTGVPKDRCLAIAAELESLLVEVAQGLRTREEVKDVKRSLVAWIARLRGGIYGLEPPAASTVVSEIAATTRRLICPLKPPLPIEIVAHILEYLFHSSGRFIATMHLQNCALVHSSWRTPAQRLLFHELRIDGDCRRILKVTENQPRLASYPRKAVLVSLSDDSSPDVARLLSTLVNLDAIVLEGTRMGGAAMTGGTNLLHLSITDGSLPTDLPVLPSVKRLTLSWSTYIDDHPIPPASFPSLISLECEGTDTESERWLKEISFAKAVKTLRCLSIESVEVEDEEFGTMTRWMDALPSLASLRCLRIHGDDCPIDFANLFKKLPPRLSYLTLEADSGEEESTTFAQALSKALARGTIPPTLRKIMVNFGGRVEEAEDVIEGRFINLQLLNACESRSIKLHYGERMWEPLALDLQYGIEAIGSY